MNNRQHLLRLSSLLLLLLLLLTSCASVPRLEAEGGRYRNNKTGITYLEAPLCYKAASYQQSKAVARISEKKVEDVVLYQINDTLSPERFLTTARFDLFYAEGSTLPTLSEMDPYRVHLGQSDAITVTFSLITEKKDIDALLAAYGDPLSFAESEVYWLLMDYEKYELRFESEEFDGLYYYLDYYHCNDEVVIEEQIDDPESFTHRFADVEVTVSEYKGAYYAAYHFGHGILRDPATGICYPTWNLLSPYVEGIEP